MHAEERFWEIYGREPEEIAFAPYRVCPIGAHSDHNLGKITGLAIDRGVRLAYGAKLNGVVELCSLQFPKRAQWFVQAVPPRQGDWADYLRGAVWALEKRQSLSVGLCGVLEGTLPIGGLSSSAAVTIAFVTALCRVNGIRLTPQELIETALDAEKNYVGIQVGSLDQSCEVLSRKDRLLYLDTRDGSHELIAAGSAMPPWEIMIFCRARHAALGDYDLLLRAGAQSHGEPLQRESGRAEGRRLRPSGFRRHGEQALCRECCPGCPPGGVRDLQKPPARELGSAL